ncbi:outer mitochondrial membrane transport complex protein-domain-containing protein [Tirmania nivea]|nr:outer mitochondrial membrane transport complex protein-domain-containing protein [Tirmania nivea]
MMELHIWGPAFGLPSIDPECLAAIAYFRCIPDLNPPSPTSKPWRIVPSSNPLLSPTRTLPALRDEHVWIGGGFNGVVEYLRKKSDGKWDLDIDLRGENTNGRQYDDGGDEELPAHAATSYTWAESVAYSSFIRSRLGSLLDISLYISEVNYANATRPEYSKSGMLPWPVQYYVPGQKRAQAWDRSEEVLRKYGLGPADVDPIRVLDSPASSGLETNAVGAGVGTGSEFGAGKGPGGVSSVFGKRPSASIAGVVFKLQTLILRSLTPVAARLVAADADPALGFYFFKREHPTSIDCLILGYLCLAIYPELPNPFLAEGIQELDGGRDGKRVCAWTHEFRKKVFGSTPIDGSKILNSENECPDAAEGILPWGKVESADLPWLTGQFASAAAQYIDGWIPSWARKKEEKPKKPETEEEQERRLKLERAVRKDKAARIATVVVGIGAFIAFLFSSGIISVVSLAEDVEDVEEELEEMEREEQEDLEGSQIDASSVTAEDLFDFFPAGAGGEGRNEGKDEGGERAGGDEDRGPEKGNTEE